MAVNKAPNLSGPAWGEVPRACDATENNRKSGVRISREVLTPDPCGVSNGIRTRDILDHNQVLYQLSYTHHAPSEGD